MTRARVNHQIRWLSCAMVVLLSHLACSTQTPAALASNQQDANQVFDGELASTTIPDDAEGNWLSICLHDNGGSQLADAKCYSKYQELLEANQTDLLRKIRAALSKPGPEGTDYETAAKLIEDSQRNWQSYVDADCEVISKVFGNGNAQGMPGGECLIGHYENRNSKLRALKQSYLDE